MSGIARRSAALLLSAASRLLPRRLSPWARAMAFEMMEIRDDRSALLFAAGCLRAALSLTIAERVRSAIAALRALHFPLSPIPWSFPAMNGIFARPRLLGLLCGAAAVGIGMAYMKAGGAPSRYLLVNFAALVLGATAWLALGRTARSSLAGSGPAVLAMSVPLLLTAWFGVAAEGASRWVSVGPLVLQVSLILLPVMIVLYARRPDRTATAGMIAAAFALAIQPDRAMAGVLAVALAASAFQSRQRLAILAASASALAFGWTLLTPDMMPASAFVDRILYTAFDIHPLAGAAVLIGAAGLIAPAAAARARGEENSSALLSFGACWSAVVAAAALGNNPTPLVGYGGSAVLGYLLSVALLPGRAGARQARAGTSLPAASPDPDPTLPELRAASPA